MTAWPWHDGERQAQRLAGGGNGGGAIRDHMPEQHRRFFAALPYVVIATQRDGWPAATLLSGTPGFIAAPDAYTLRIAVPLQALAAADPAAAGLVSGAPVGLLGIDLATRRRNRANGVVGLSGPDGFDIDVRQSFGNCPQYIHLREAAAVPERAAAPAEALAGLDAGARAAIAAADTFFVASSARTEEETGGVDISHRGGPPGFVQLEGDTLTIPDYRGNRYFNTLGNLVAEPRAALLFVDFARGDLLQLQGRTEIVWDGPAVRALPGAERLWRVTVAGGWRRRGAIPLRWTAVDAAVRERG